MKRSRKIIFVIAALTVTAGVYAYQNLGGWVTREAEHIASEALGVKVSIGSIHISLGEKKVTVSSIKIANPPGYKKSHAITADGILIGLNTASKEIIDFKDIQVKGSVVNLEVNEKGMNLYDLRALASRKEQRQSAGSEQVRVIVQHMVIDASTINPSISMIDREVSPIKMPAITFSNMGKGGGMEAGDAVVHILTKYIVAAERSARQSGMLGGLPGVGDAEKIFDDAAGNLKKLFK